VRSTAELNCLKQIRPTGLLQAVACPA
jgi:hypothetical protein